MKLDFRIWICTRCHSICKVYPRKNSVGAERSKEGLPYDEDRCFDEKAPGGYWYCSYIELIPKKKKNKAGDKKM